MSDPDGTPKTPSDHGAAAEPGHRRRTAARDRIPWVQMLAYGLGGFVPIALFNSVGQLSGLIVNVGLGV
jgi:hypothetical protein